MRIILSIGSNVGNRKKNLDTAISFLSENCYINILQCSPIYETEPYGNIEQNCFFNVVLIAETSFLPMNLLLICKTIEFLLGRRKTFRWSKRIMDIDILMYDDLILDSATLTIPHKYLHLRNFVLVPLNDIDSNIMHPILNKNITQLLIECPDKSFVKKYI